MSSKPLRSFDIDIFKLADKAYQYQFEFDDVLFGEFDHSLIQKGKGVCNLGLTKSSTMIELDFQIIGSIGLTCDRSLEEFDHPISITENLILKFGDEDEVLSENIEIIHRDTQRINIANYIYEFVNLAVPLKRLHPKYKDDLQGDSLIYSSTSEIDNESASEDTVDPRWEALKKLKDN